MPELGLKGPGVAPVHIPEVDEAAAKYVKARDARQRCTVKEVEAKKELMDLLKANEKKIGRDAEFVLRYEYDDLLVMLLPGEDKLKVRKASDESGGDDD